jgi:hypothetical protein
MRYTTDDFCIGGKEDALRELTYIIEGIEGNNGEARFDDFLREKFRYAINILKQNKGGHMTFKDAKAKVGEYVDVEVTVIEIGDWKKVSGYSKNLINCEDSNRLRNRISVMMGDGMTIPQFQIGSSYKFNVKVDKSDDGKYTNFTCWNKKGRSNFVMMEPIAKVEKEDTPPPSTEMSKDDWLAKEIRGVKVKAIIASGIPVKECEFSTKEAEDRLAWYYSEIDRLYGSQESELQDDDTPAYEERDFTD